VDEAEGVGKGADSVVSMAHHYFGHHILATSTPKSTLTIQQERTRTTPSFGMPCGEF